MNSPLLEVRNLVRDFAVKKPGLFAGDGYHLRAVDGVNLILHRGETLALVGESGCGKTTLARTAMLLLTPTAGSVHFVGDDVTDHRGSALKPMRRRIQMVFQDPYSSLNPRLPAGAIIAEPLVVHRLGNRAERRKRVAALAETVGLRVADLARYPHQFSGGQRQRIAIARALAPDPDVVIADEPVSALDVSIQSQVLNLFQDLQKARGLTYLFISHDLAVVRHLADRIAVMYLGAIVETGPASAVFATPRHPYTQALIAAAPVIGRGKRRPGRSLLGDVPSPLHPPSGCPFHPRCPQARDRCTQEKPSLKAFEGGSEHAAACHFAEDVAP